MVSALARDRDRAMREGLDELNACYAGRDAAWWARRFQEALGGGGPPLRILASVSTHTTFLQYCMRDAARAARKLGCEFHVLTESRAFDSVSPLTFHRLLRELQPDLFFALDHLRSSFPAHLPDNLPLLTWDQDALQHVFTAGNLAKMSPLDAVVGLPKVECIVRHGCDPRQFLAAHIASCPEEFDASTLSEDDLAPFRCDVSYVSHGSQTAEQFHRSERDTYPDENARRLLDALLPLARQAVLEQGAMDGGRLRALLARAEQQTGIRVVDPVMRDRLIGWHLWRLCDRFFRHQALEWAAEWAVRRGRSLRIYGNGWETHPTLSPFAAGAIQNGRELLCLYRASAINLQLMPAGFIHQRALDGLLAGGFFLARATHADRRDSRLPRLVQGIRRQGWASGAALLAGGDEQTIGLFHEMRTVYGYPEQQVEDAFHAILADAQLDYPAEVFPGFEAIVYADSASFQRMADAFTADPARRAAMAAQMRDVVVRRYTYAAAMRRFLSFHRDYLASRASDRPGARPPAQKPSPA
jgi:hypothetical protein